MTDNHKRKGRVSGFLRKQSFTIALAICLVAIAITAIFAATGNNGQVQEPNVGVVDQQDESLANKQTPTAAPTESPVPSETPKAVSSTVVLTMPVNGNIIKDFSIDKLVFFQTLNTWATHNGIDIACGDNKNAMAALSGEVESVASDQSGGIVVIISHAGGQKTVYSGLSDVTVKAKDSVDSGQIIGTVGTPAFEASDGEHLHFEYIVNGKYADPTKYFSQNK